MQVRYWKAGNNGSVEQRVFHADEDFAVLTNLFPYTQYVVMVLAYSVAGDGPVNSPALHVTTAESGNCLMIVTYTCCV